IKYDMVERARIDQILQEQNFQISGMVSDDTAVSIGKFLGAQVIIIGDISGSGNTRRLVFRALDVETGKIMGISSERF
ncbi:MAG: CsgG/HfaB family protein, partial [Treponema sp.]|nr:CsgG/HfaB family protein [Treponema sp.]